MSENRRYRKFTAQQKTELVLASLRGPKTITELCREHDISDSLLRKWREQFLAAGAERLSGKAERTEADELRRLEADYFLTAEIELGDLSHGVPILAVTEDQPLRLVLDPAGPSFSVMAQLYDSDYAMFGSMVKDYVRNMVFPRVADFVPSSTRQGAEAFLKSIRRTRDVFEYEAEDPENFSGIWEEYLAGNITMGEAAQRSIYVVQQTVQVIDPAATGRVHRRRAGRRG